MQLARTERLIILVRPVAYGQPITAEDLATVEVSRHRPQQLAGVGDPGLVIGKYAARAPWRPTTCCNLRTIYSISLQHHKVRSIGNISFMSSTIAR